MTSFESATPASSPASSNTQSPAHNDNTGPVPNDNTGKQCLYNAEQSGVHKIRSHEYASRNETEWLTYLQKGPLSVTIDASHIQFYLGGVLTDCGSVQGTNHAVQLVGYGTDAGKDYWLIRNSWGTHLWGEHGYFRIERNKNLCNIALYAPEYPVV